MKNTRKLLALLLALILALGCLAAWADGEPEGEPVGEPALEEVIAEEPAFDLSDGGNPEGEPVGEPAYEEVIAEEPALEGDGPVIEEGDLEPTYGEPTWEWNEGYNVATIKIPVTYNGETEYIVEPLQDDAITIKTVPATCTEPGKKVYTAVYYFEPLDKDFTDTQTVTLADEPALGHIYGEPAWAWAEDNKSATATFTCSREGCSDKTKTVDAAVTPAETAATCTAAGKTVYTALVTVEGKSYSDTKEVAIPATGHSYGEPKWTWAEDNKSATATFTCTANDDTQTVDATVGDPAVTAPTCTEPGKTTYTATATFNDKEYTDTKEIAGEAATGHSYGEPKWTWAEDYTSATATFTCTANDDTQTVEAAVGDPATTAATCTEPGKTVYTATATFEGKEYTGTKEVAGEAATGHAYGKPVWKWADDFTSATATFTCANCNDAQTVAATITGAPVEAGGTKYTATVTFLEATYTDEAFDADVPRHTLTISYVNENGAQVAEPYVGQFADGEKYAVASPVLARLAPDVAVVEGTMGAADVAATVTYADDHCVITFRYDKSIATQVAWSREATALRLNTFKIKSGYGFTGWNTSSDGTGTAYADGAEIVPEGNVTLYAQTGRLYTLKFNSNKGQGNMASLKVVGGATVTLPKNAYTPGTKGGVFAGWNTAADGSGASFPDEGQLTMPMGNVNLYAQWQGREVNLKLTSNGGKGKTVTIKVHVGDTIKLPANAFTHKNGYAFVGWAAYKDGSGARYADEAEIVVAGNTTLFAQWAGMEANVKFTGADKKDAITVTVPGTITLPECLKTQKGKIFTGWLDGSKAVHAPGEEITVWHNMTFKAQWSKAGCVKFKANKGSGSMDPLYGLPGTRVNLTPNEFTRGGYEFVGWNTKADGTGTAYKDGASYYFAYTNTVTLYAQWRANGIAVVLTKTGPISKSGKKQALEATLTKDGQPVKVKGEYVLFSFRDTTKKLKTNKDGVATWKFSSSELKKLTAGSKMEVTATYGGTTVRKWVKIVE